VNAAKVLVDSIRVDGDFVGGGTTIDACSVDGFGFAAFRLNENLGALAEAPRSSSMVFSSALSCCLIG
jgi:hypothetical protein